MFLPVVQQVGRPNRIFSRTIPHVLVPKSSLKHHNTRMCLSLRRNRLPTLHRAQAGRYSYICSQNQGFLDRFAIVSEQLRRDAFAVACAERHIALGGHAYAVAAMHAVLRPRKGAAASGTGMVAMPMPPPAM